MGALLDLVLLLAIAKEAVTLGSLVPFELWASMALALPFFLGMAASLRAQAAIGILRDPLSALIAQGLSALTLVIFLASLGYQGLAPAYWGLVGVGVLMYVIGRVLGFLFRSVIFLLVVLAMVFWFAR